MKNYLEISNLNFSYFSKFSFQCPSFTVKKSEIIVLVGASGSGKTTFLRLLAGLLKPVSGKISLDSSVMCDQKIFVPPNKRKIGFVFQDYALFPHLNVKQNIEFAFKAIRQKYSFQNIKKELEWAELENLENRYPAELSGGQQQRVSLVRSLVTHPKLLLMDEPFTGLDSSLRKRIVVQTIQILRDFDMTGIIVTHSPEDLKGLIDRVQDFESLCTSFSTQS